MAALLRLGGASALPSVRGGGTGLKLGLGLPHRALSTGCGAQQAEYDPQWYKLATKELRGEDPAEVLTWHTAEVRALPLLARSPVWGGDRGVGC